MCKISLHIFILTLIVSIASGQGFAGSSKLVSGDTVRAEYWVPRRPPKAHYTIDCSIDLTKGLLEGTEIIRFKNTTSRAIHRLNVKWTSLGSMEIIKKDKTVKILAETKEESQSSSTFIEISEPIRPEEEVDLQIKFHLLVPEYANVDKIPVTDWYPHLWWGFETQDDFDVKVETTPGYTLATSGILDDKTGYYHAERVRSFGLFLGKDLKTIEAKVEDVRVCCIFTTKGEKCARLLLRTAVDVINFYRERFGFYPYANLIIIPGMDHPAGGYPVATNIVAVHGMEQMDTMPELHWRWITAHEIGHQYWGEYVMEKDEPEWLWIGLGVYADREYSRARGLGPEKHQGMMGRYIRGVREGLDTTMNRSEEELRDIKFDFNNVVTHGKGYSVISALDCILGKRVFDKIYRRCLKEFGGRRLSVHEFRAVCEEESRQDLGWFFDQWVNSNKFLSYEISSKKSDKKGDRCICRVEVKCLGDLKMPVPVVAYFEDGTSRLKFTDRLLDTNVLEFESKAPLSKVQLNPKGTLALVVPPPQSLVEKQLTREMRRVPLTGAGKQALRVFKKVRNSNLSDAEAWFCLGLALYDGKYYTEALESFCQSQEIAAENSIDDFVSLVWQGHILDLFERRDEALDKYKEALKKAKDFWMRHDQYGIKVNRHWAEERIKKPFHR